MDPTFSPTSTFTFASASSIAFATAPELESERGGKYNHRGHWGSWAYCVWV